MVLVLVLVRGNFPQDAVKYFLSRLLKRFDKARRAVRGCFSLVSKSYISVLIESFGSLAISPLLYPYFWDDTRQTVMTTLCVKEIDHGNWHS